MNEPIRVYGMNQVAIVPIEDIKEISRTLKEIRKSIVEFNTDGIEHTYTLAKAGSLINSINDKLLQIQFSEE